MGSIIIPGKVELLQERFLPKVCFLMSTIDIDTLSIIDKCLDSLQQLKNCGAGGPGSPGFMPGNSCARGSGSGGGRSGGSYPTPSQAKKEIKRANNAIKKADSALKGALARQSANKSVVRRLQKDLIAKKKEIQGYENAIKESQKRQAALRALLNAKATKEQIEAKIKIEDKLISELAVKIGISATEIEKIASALDKA